MVWGLKGGAPKRKKADEEEDMKRQRITTMDIISEMDAYEVKESDPQIVKTVLKTKSVNIKDMVKTASLQDLDKMADLAKKYEFRGYIETVANGFLELDKASIELKDL
eukprot:2682030-Amphidinium_carterae.1